MTERMDHLALLWLWDKFSSADEMSEPDSDLPRLSHYCAPEARGGDGGGWPRRLAAPISSPYSFPGSPCPPPPANILVAFIAHRRLCSNLVASVFSALVWPCPCRRRRCASQVTAPCWPSTGDISGTACPIYCRRKWQHPVRPAHPSLMPHPSAAASSVLLLATTSIPNQFRNCCKLQLLEWTDVTKYIDFSQLQ